MAILTVSTGIQRSQTIVGQPKWHRIILMIILGYEAAGCLLGGALLIAAPDGRYMQMPVDMMHGVFSDFLIPGAILFTLGILNTIAFISVLRKWSSDWLIAGLGLGGLFIWFVVEIIILHELHWLHLMWGFPVVLGWAVLIPLILFRYDNIAIRKVLLFCGILSSVWYVCINIIVPLQYPGYDISTFTVSELSAIGAPTRILWFALVIPYPMLLLFFGWGVWYYNGHNRHLRMAGMLIIIYSIINIYWPPMHQREIIATGGGTLTDNMHIAWAMMTLLFNLLLMWQGFAALGKKFRIYTIATWLIFIVFGVLTFTESPGIESGAPTPFIGLWERINMGAFLLWIVVFAVSLIRKHNMPGSKNTLKLREAIA